MAEEPSEIEKAIARQKSYIGASIIVFLLYCLFYIPGLIFNLMYFKDARKKAAITGEKPPGYGCLLVLLFWGLVPLIITIFLVVVIVGGSSDVAPFVYTLF